MLVHTKGECGATVCIGPKAPCASARRKLGRCPSSISCWSSSGSTPSIPNRRTRGIGSVATSGGGADGHTEGWITANERNEAGPAPIASAVAARRASASSVAIR